MFRRTFSIAAIASTILLAIAGVGTGLCVARGNNRATFNVGLHDHPLVLSGGGTIHGTSGYSVCTEHSGITLYYTDLDLVTSRDVGVDSRPLWASFQPSIETVLRVPFGLMVATLAGAIPVPAVWVLGRLRPRVGRGFLVIRRLLGALQLLGVGASRSPVAG
jgi:hypothetical protein